jgi:hypothetical protein
VVDQRWPAVREVSIDPSGGRDGSPTPSGAVTGPAGSVPGGSAVVSFALTLGSHPGGSETILLLLDERRDAEEIAVELRRKGHPVEVRAVPAPGREREADPAP